MKIEKVLKSEISYEHYQSVILNILYSSIQIENSEESIFRKFGITRSQYNVLRILRGSKTESMNLFEIQGRMLKRMSNTTRLVDKLLDKQYVERKICSDNRRKVEVSITNNGLDLLVEIDPVLKSKHEERLNSLTYEEQSTLVNLLEKIR